jgi:ABC-2 type transport system permease protein
VLRPTIRTVRADPDAAAPMRGATRIETRLQNWYNPTLDYKHYMVPGILVALVTMIGTLLTAQNIAREKEMGTLEQINVTPITRAQFIVAKLLPFWALAMFELGLGLLVGWLVFHIPVRGSLFLLFGCAAVYLVVALAIGLWISTVVETQQQAMFVSFFILMIYLLMSGLFTPIDSMPRWVQLVSELNPVRHLVTIARAILIKGAGLGEIVRPIAILAVYGATVLMLAIRQHRKRAA